MNKSYFQFLLRGLLVIVLFWAADWGVQSLLLHGLNKYYGLGTDSNILIVGSSQAMLGIDKELLEAESGLKVSKYTIEGVNMLDREKMIQYYFSTCTKKPDIVFVSVDKYLFSDKRLSENSYKLLLPFIANPYVGEYILANTSAEDYWMYRLVGTIRYNDVLLNSARRGLMNNRTNSKVGTTLDYSTLYGSERKVEFIEKYRQSFQRTMRFLESQKVKTVLLCVPYIEEVNNDEPEKTAIIQQYFQDAATQYRNTEYWDFGPVVSKERTWYYDVNHLHSDGQKEFTKLLNQRIKYE